MVRVACCAGDVEGDAVRLDGSVLDAAVILGTGRAGRGKGRSLPGSLIERQSGPAEGSKDLVGDHPASWVKQLGLYPLLQDPDLKAACPPILRPVHQVVAGRLSEIVRVHRQQPDGQPIDPGGCRGGWKPVIYPVIDPEQRCPQPRHRTGLDNLGMAEHHGRAGQHPWAWEPATVPYLRWLGQRS